MRNRMPVATLTGAPSSSSPWPSPAIVLGRPGPEQRRRVVAVEPPPSRQRQCAGVRRRRSRPDRRSPRRRRHPRRPRPGPTVGPCDPANLAAPDQELGGRRRLADRHRRADQPRNDRPACSKRRDRSQLVDGAGTVRIDGTEPRDDDAPDAGSPGGVVTTLVEASNDCKPAPVAARSASRSCSATAGGSSRSPSSPTDTTDPAVQRRRVAGRRSSMHAVGGHR